MRVTTDVGVARNLLRGTRRGLGAKPPEAEDKFSRYDGGTCTHVIIILFTVAL